MEHSREVRQENFLAEVFKFSLLALLIVVPIRIFIAQPYIVQGSSMYPTFENGQYLIVDQISYRFEPPERGDVVIFRYPQDPSKFFIKRIIGLPNENVEIRGEDVIIKNEAQPEGFILSEPYVKDTSSWGSSQVKTLGSTEYFVMGDNRSASSDSRMWGALPTDHIMGRALLRLFPLSDTSVSPGTFNPSVSSS